MRASKDGDYATVLDLIADDAVFMVAGRAPFGKDSFAAEMQNQTDMEIAGTSDILELAVMGEWAFMRSHLSFKIRIPGRPTQLRSGNVLTILKKRADGAWVLFRDANMVVASQARDGS
jgi:uncharacterized protein (TIGR02246 family)